ncbi:MAG: four helix bundle suffix domain-containing protein [Candidatus Latescibacteria bacterium]|nr:four helix bundle suffix domain-containing protein [Candidatus Latescibacterota bacterium]
MPDREPLIPKHGGYRKLKSFQVAQLVFDVTVRFCDRYIDKYSRTHDQMVQAARSGVQNIAEGSQASGTSKKTELKLTNVARASLEELRLDYEDFLRQRQMTMLPPDHPALMRFKKKRCATLQEVQAWVSEEIRRQNTDQHRQTPTDKDGVEHPMSIRVGERPCPSLPSSALAANAALSLLNLACYFLDRQIAAQAKAFEEEGGFTERLYRIRSKRRRSKP